MKKDPKRGLFSCLTGWIFQIDPPKAVWLRTARFFASTQSVMTWSRAGPTPSMDTWHPQMRSSARI